MSERKVHVVTDSTADMPYDLRVRYGIDMIPAAVNFGEISCVDGLNLNIEDFKYLLRENPGIIPTTGVLGPEQYVKVYDRHPGSDIVSVHIGQKFSKLYEVADMVARQNQEDRRIKPYNTGTVSMGIGFMAMQAALLAQDGADIETIIASLDEMKERLTVVAAVGDMAYLSKGGRVSHIQGVVGSLLNIHPILRIDHDSIGNPDKPRTMGKATRKLIEFAKDFGPLEQAAVVHFDSERSANNLATDLQSLPIQNKDILVCELGPVVATHCGFGTLGLCLLRQRA